MLRLPWIALLFNIWLLGNKKTFSNDIHFEKTKLDLKYYASSSIGDAFAQPFEHGIYAPNFFPLVLFCVLVIRKAF